MPDHFTLLLEWRRNETSVRGLAKLPHDFYPTTQTYLTELKRSYETDLRENPSGRKGEISRQTYQRASSLARDIVEGRVQKVLTAAFQASIGGARDLPNSLPEERAIFEQLLGVLLEHRRSVASYLEPGAPSGSARSAPSAGGMSPTTPSAPSPAARETAPAAPLPRSTPPFTYVRILQDGRPIEVGADTIDLHADDIVTLPPETAKLLIGAKIAEPVETNATRPAT
jgi:DNA replication initiation complex subunit (GINS family)